MEVEALTRQAPKTRSGRNKERTGNQLPDDGLMKTNSMVSKGRWSARRPFVGSYQVEK